MSNIKKLFKLITVIFTLEYPTVIKIMLKNMYGFGKMLMMYYHTKK